MAVTEHSVTFAGSATPCPGTGLFSFSRPPGYAHTPGQYLSLTLDTREGTQTKDFSHCDAPTDPQIQILTRMTGSAFKDALAALVPGQFGKIGGPFGRLVVPDGVDKVAFLVGGVGITPMRSILRDAVQRSTGITALVFDGNLDDTCIPMREEFDAWEAGHPSIRFVHVLERPSPEWAGERGFIGPDTVRRHCDPRDGWHWFVSGPPAMVDAMGGVLDALGVDRSHASFESFAGYR